jgi:L-ascorbate metabolism protein UlaG (beta-lactamase superfamily)
MPEPSGALGSLHFIGTATSVLRLGNFTLLTDPNFLHRGQRAYLGYGLTSRRRTSPALRIDDLPPLDLVLLSHLHGDHWDRVAEAGLDHQLPVVTTPQAARHLRRRGFAASAPLQVWETYEETRGQQRLRITAMPGRHGPGIVDALLPPVMGSLLELESDGRRLLRVYISGDTLFRPFLREIAERYGDIDVAVLHLGGTKLLNLVLVTMDGEQGAALTSLLDPGAVVPIHHDDYTVFKSPVSDFVAAARARGLESRVRVVDRGEEISLVARGSPAG